MPLLPLEGVFRRGPLEIPEPDRRMGVVRRLQMVALSRRRLPHRRRLRFRLWFQGLLWPSLQQREQLKAQSSAIRVRTSQIQSRVRLAEGSVGLVHRPPAALQTERVRWL